MPWFLGNVSRMLEGSAGPKSQNGKVNFNRDLMKYTNIEIPCYFRILPLWCVLKTNMSVVALIWNPGLIYATNWILKYFLRLIQKMGTIYKRLKWTMSGLVLWMRHLMWAHLPFLRGHAATGCHFRTTQILKLEKSQKTSCLGLNQVCYCSCFLNTLRNTAASVGLDLDSLALWWFVELWSQIWSGPYLKCFNVLIKNHCHRVSVS